MGEKATAEKKDNAIIYKNVFGIGTSLRYTPNLSGVKEDIILEKDIGKNRFEFTLTAEGLEPKVTENGVVFYDKEGNEIMHFDKIVAYDANGKFIDGDIQVSKKDNEQYLIAVSVSNEFLKASDTAYPICIDPYIDSRDISVDSFIQDATVFSIKPPSEY